MASKIKINLDTSKENYILAKCKQNDDLTLEASIFENGLEKDLTNAAITIQALKADKTYIIQNTNITKENNKIIADLDRDFTRAAGKTEIEILLVESGKQNTTFSFCLEVVGSVIRGAVQSSNTVTILEELEEKIVEAGQVRDETEQLIVSGGAATKGDIDLVNASLDTIENNLTNLSKQFDKSFIIANRTTDFVVPSNTDTTLPFNNILNKEDFSLSSDGSRALVESNGVFLISVAVRWDSKDDTNERVVELRKYDINSDSIINLGKYHNNNLPNIHYFQTYTTLVYCKRGDQLFVNVYQARGSECEIKALDYDTSLKIVKII